MYLEEACVSGGLTYYVRSTNVKKSTMQKEKADQVREGPETNGK